LVWNNKKIEWWYRQNTILYVQSEYLSSHPRLMAECERRGGIPLALVHPELLETMRHPKLGLRGIARNLPGALKRWFLSWKSQLFGVAAPLGKPRTKR